MRYSTLASCWEFKWRGEPPRDSGRFCLKKMPGAWLCLKKSLNCKSPKSTDVLDTKSSNSNNKNKNKNKNRIQRQNSFPASSSRCSRSLSNLRNIITNRGSNQTLEKLTISSPRSVESWDPLKPTGRFNLVTDNSIKCQRTGYGGSCRHPRTEWEEKSMVHYRSRRSFNSVSFKNRGTDHCPLAKSCRASFDSEFHKFDALVCQKCCRKFPDLDSVEAHHLSKHSVSALVEGDSSREIVEMICNTRKLSKSHNPRHRRVSRVLKIHNIQNTIAQFENYRELIKIKASRMTKKHPRCLADGNELLRFHGTTITCSLGSNGSRGLCVSDQCGICRILRYGFHGCPIKNESKDAIGVFTCSTSSRALESIVIAENKNASKALILCRVIAGRIRRPLEVVERNSGLSEFDSVAGKLVNDSNVDELYLLSPYALLPCFVIVFKS